MKRTRAFRLLPWVVRAVVPPRLSGAYILSDGYRATYVGRSDRDLRSRLVGHARAERAKYFAYDVHPGSWQSFMVESANYHLIAGESENQVHPAVPVGEAKHCPFCPEAVRAVINRNK